MGLLMKVDPPNDSPEPCSIESYLSKPPAQWEDLPTVAEDASHLPFPSRVLLLWVCVLLGMQAVLLAALLWKVITYTV